jgi:DNA-binding NarL/FixJ family response regulator
MTEAAKFSAQEIRIEHAEARVEQAEFRTEQAETRTEQAKARTEQAEARTEQAEARAEQAETRTEQAKTRAELAETRTEQAEIRTEQAETSLHLAVHHDHLSPESSTPPQVSPSEVKTAHGGSLDQLTARQKEILRLLAEGQNTKQSAELLKVSPKTIEYHRKKLMACLNIHDVPGLVRFALRVGLISPEA